MIMQHFVISAVLLLLTLILALLSRRAPMLKRSSRLLLWLFLVQLLRDAAGADLVQLSISLTKVADALFIFLLVSLVIYLIKDFGQAWLTRRGITITKLFWDVMLGVAYSLLILVLLKEIFSIDVTPLLATSAVLTVVIGLAVQDTLINLIAGTVFHFEDSIRREDWIQLGELIGQVRELTWRTVQLVTPDRELVVVPNQDLTRKQFINLTRQKAARVMEVGVSYSDDPDKVINILRQALMSTPGVLWNPEPVIYIRDFADFSIIYHIRFFIENYTNFRRLEGDVRRSIWYGFQRHGITIPFPIRTVQMARRPPEAAVATDPRISEAVSQVEMFRILDPQDLDAMAEHARIITYPARAVIAAEGETGQSMFVILQGSVEILRAEKKVAELNQNDIFGEIALFTGARRGASVRARTATEVLVIHKTGIDAILRQNVEVVAKFERMIEERLRTLPVIDVHDQKSAGHHSIIGRIRKYLLG